VRRVVTIGVYEWDLGRFVDALNSAGVRLVVDVRQRRGVRGGEYPWANAARLQDALAGPGVAYSHYKSSPPPPSCATSSTPRTPASGSASAPAPSWPPEYRVRYTREILDHVDLAPLVDPRLQLLPGPLVRTHLAAAAALAAAHQKRATTVVQVGLAEPSASLTRNPARYRTTISPRRRRPYAVSRAARNDGDDLLHGR
jgi:hypothetical protein